MRIGDKVILTFPDRPNEDTEAIGCYDHWLGRRFEGTISRITPRASHRGTHCVEFDEGTPSDRCIRSWYCHPSWLEPFGGPW